MLAALLALVVLTGCVAIPDSGPVTEGQVEADDVASELVYLAEEPRAGATQEQIILGFLAAGISPDGDFSIAREYLAGPTALAWDPAARVIVRSGQPEVTLAGEAAASAQVTGVAGLDGHGAMRLEGEEHTLDFRLERVDGEWRITAAPDGIVLSAFYFAQLFRAHPLHWVSLDGARAVPEIRWFERTASTLAARIAEAQLGQPAAWLAPAVRSAAVPGAQQVLPPRLEGTVATVTLDFSQMERGGTASFEPLAAQLALSLRPLGVREVRVEVETIDGFAASSLGAPLATGEVDQRPLVLEGATLRTIGAGSAVPQIDDVGPALAALEATSFTVGAAGGVAHGRGTATWLQSGVDPVPILGGVGVAPTVDDSGWVLLADPAASQLLAWRADEVVALPLPAEIGYVEALELSRDGARLAIASVDDGAGAVWAVSVVRGEDGQPTSLGEPYPLPLVEGTPSDVTWVSPTEVAVLSSVSDAAQIVVIALGGESEQLPQPGVPVQAIVGGTEGVSTLRALGDDGSLLSLRGRVWTAATGIGPVSLVATQQ